MVREDPVKIQKQVQEQDDATYGTDYTEGVHEKFSDTEEVLKSSIGNIPRKKRPFLLAEEVEQDEKTRSQTSPEDHSGDQEKTEE